MPKTKTLPWYHGEKSRGLWVSLDIRRDMDSGRLVTAKPDILTRHEIDEVVRYLQARLDQYRAKLAAYPLDLIDMPAEAPAAA